MTPFGFGVDRHDHVLVSEAFGGAADASAVSSYRLSGDVERARVLAHDASRKLDKAASAGVIHQNQAANRKSAIQTQAAGL